MYLKCVDKYSFRSQSDTYPLDYDLKSESLATTYILKLIFESYCCYSMYFSLQENVQTFDNKLHNNSSFE